MKILLTSCLSFLSLSAFSATTSLETYQALNQDLISWTLGFALYSAFTIIAIISYIFIDRALSNRRNKKSIKPNLSKKINFLKG